MKIYLNKIFKSLSDPNRIKILELIAKKSCDKDACDMGMCLNDFAKSLKLTLPTVSHHVKELVNADILKTTKKGKYVYCEINKNAFKDVDEFLNYLLK
jgi:ArsR family transcriptional regulator